MTWRRTDAAGFVLRAKALGIDDLPPGAYMLALRLVNPQTGEVIGRSARFQVAGREEASLPSWSPDRFRRGLHGCRSNTL